METPQNEIGVLWEKKSRKGNVYYSGKITLQGSEMEIVLFYIESENPKAPRFKVVKSRYTQGQTYEGGRE